MMDELDSGAHSPVVLDIRKDRIIAGFKTVIGVLEFCETAIKIMSKPFQQKFSFRMSLHVGPLRINTDEVRQELSGDAIDIAQRLHELAMPGAIHATGIVAAILALEGKKYSFDYTDTLSTAGDAKALDVFKVQIHQLVP
jgi:class 3 adenylate cyclase